MSHTLRRDGSTKWACSLALGVCLGLGSVVLPARVLAQAQPAEDAARVKIDVDIVDQDLRDGIGMIFKDSGLNYVIGEGVYSATPVTLRLMQVPREQALSMLLEPKGFMYVKQNNVYLIKPKPQMIMPGQLGPGMPGGGSGSGAPYGPPGSTPYGAPGASSSEAPPVMAMGVPGMGSGEGGVPGLGASSGTATAAQRSNIPVKIRLKYMSPIELLTGVGGGGMMGGMGGGGMGGYGGYGGQQGGMGGGMGGYGGGGMGGYGGGGMGGYGGGGMGGMGGGMGGFGGGMGGFGGGQGGFGGGGGGFGGGTNGWGNNNNNNNNNGGGGATFRPRLGR